MKPISIVGLGLSPKNLTREHLEIIEQADILIGGKRLLDYFQDFSGIKKEISKEIGKIADYIKNRMKTPNSDESIVVLASGDPMFFGIGSVLADSLNPENVVVYPNISSVSAAFSRIKESWHDVRVISLHGRQSEEDLFTAISQSEKVAVFTDPKNNPVVIAELLLENGIAESSHKMCVFEKLGTAMERFDWYDLSQAVKMQFSEPNMVVLKRVSIELEGIKPFPGMPDKWFDRQKGIITKAEVRAVTIAKLCLDSSSYILWDLGAGSGSISMEASLFLKKGGIFAVEQNLDRIEQIKTNRKRFGVNNLEIVHAVLPDGLENLLRPDRIFIGGGGGNLGNIIEKASKYLKPGGLMVLNTVLISSTNTALEALNDLKYKTDIVQIQINRGQNMTRTKRHSIRLEAQNPVFIISGEKV